MASKEVEKLKKQVKELKEETKTNVPESVKVTWEEAKAKPATVASSYEISEYGKVTPTQKVGGELVSTEEPYTVTYGKGKLPKTAEVYYEKTVPGIWGPKQELNIQDTTPYKPTIKETLKSFGKEVKEYTYGVPGAFQSAAKYLGEKREQRRQTNILETTRQLETAKFEAALLAKKKQIATYQRGGISASPFGGGVPQNLGKTTGQLGSGNLSRPGFGSPGSERQISITAQQLGGRGGFGMGFGSPTVSNQMAITNALLGAPSSLGPQMQRQYTPQQVPMRIGMSLGPQRQTMPIQPTQQPSMGQFMQPSGEPVRQKRKYVISGMYSPKTNPEYRPRQQWRKVTFINPKTGEVMEAKVPKVPRQQPEEYGGEEYEY